MAIAVRKPWAKPGIGKLAGQKSSSARQEWSPLVDLRTKLRARHFRYFSVGSIAPRRLARGLRRRPGTFGRSTRHRLLHSERLSVMSSAALSVTASSFGAAVPAKAARADTRATSDARDFSAVLEETDSQPTAPTGSTTRVTTSDARDNDRSPERPDQELPADASAVDGAAVTSSPMALPLSALAGSAAPGAASGIEIAVDGVIAAPTASPDQGQTEGGIPSAASPVEAGVQLPEPNLIPAATGARSTPPGEKAAAMQAAEATAAAVEGGPPDVESSETLEAGLATLAAFDPAEGNAATRMAAAGAASAQKSASSDATTAATDAASSDEKGTQETRGPSLARAEAASPSTSGKALPDPGASIVAMPPSPVDDPSSGTVPASSAPTSDLQSSGPGQTSLLSTLSNAAIHASAQIAAQIVKKLEGRSTRFEMALTPDDLGRVDVSLDIDEDGALRATLAFDNPVAATELRGRADELRRQLMEAGFSLADDALSFAERDPSSDHGGAFDRQTDPRNARAFGAASRLTAEADLSLQTPHWISLSLTPVGVDMKV